MTRKVYRIGGDMELAIPLLISPKKRELSDLTKQHLNFMWTDTGRSAIYLAIEDMEKQGCKKVVYLPSFICDAVVQPFLEKGFQLRYYSMGSDLKSPKYLPEKLDKEIFLFIHYFGLENSPIVEWLKEKRTYHHFYVIEDCAQAALSLFDQNVSDYKIFSYRKITPQPDGGLLVCKRDFKIQMSCDNQNFQFLSDQIQGKIERALTNNEKVYLSLLKDSEASLNRKIVPYRMSQFSTFLMERIDFEEISDVRRKNWLLVYRLLKQNDYLKKYVHPLFYNLTIHEVPLGFPIVIQAGFRDHLRQFLFQQNIFCPIHWIISNNQYEDDTYLSLNILTLPIDQRMNEDQIFYLMDKISQFFLEVEND